MPETTSAELLVICLCAEWCGVCRGYRATLDALPTRLPGVATSWIDVEDDADFIAPLDVENFPALLIVSGDTPVFFGTVTPQPETLERLVRAQRDGGVALPDPELRALVARVRARRAGDSAPVTAR